MDSSFKLIDETEIININVSHYIEMCYTKGVNELSDFEFAVGIIEVYETNVEYAVSSEVVETMKRVTDLTNDKIDLLYIIGR